MKKIIIILLCCQCVVSCKNKNMEIEPIIKEFNDSAKYGIQYFEISDYKNLSAEELVTKLEDFEKMINKSRKYKIYTNFQVLFYKKSLFANYKNHIYETAEENEFGGIEGYNDNIISKIYYYKEDPKSDNYLYTRIIYNKDKIILEKKDTISFK